MFQPFDILKSAVLAVLDAKPDSPDGRERAAADNAKLTTALGAKIKVDVRKPKHQKAQVWLKDADTDDRDPRVVVFNINAGNRQIAHAIDRVLRPVNLP